MRPCRHHLPPIVCVALLLLSHGPIGRLHGQEKKADAATRQYDAAVAAQNRGAFEAAAAQWTSFIDTYKTDPRCDRAFHYLGVCYFKTNKLDLARQCFEIVIKTFPKCELLDATYLQLGLTHYSEAQSGKAGAYAAAAAAFDTLIDKFPEGKHVGEALFYRGECLYHRGKKREAAETYARLLARFPADKLAGDALYALGVARQELGEHAEAEKSYAQFLEKYPDSSAAAEVTMRRAGALADLKQYAEAAALYASIRTKWPDSKLLAAGDVGGGRCYYLAGRLSDARKVLEPVVAAGGEPAAQAAHWLARSWLKEGKPNEALVVLDRLRAKLGAGRETAQLAMDRADALYDIPGRRDESGPLYAAIVARFPKDPLAPQALYMAGFVALGQRDYATAMKHAAAFLAAYPDHPRAVDVTDVAAEGHLELGHYAEAEKLFAGLLKANPGHADAERWRIRRGLALYRAKQYAETVAWLQPMLAESVQPRPAPAALHTPDVVAEAHYLVGSSQVELKQPEVAVKSLEGVLSAQPKWRQADQTLLLLAQAYGELKQRAKAEAALRRLLAEFPTSQLLDQVHYRLGEDAYAAGALQTAAAEYRQVLDKWPQSTMRPQALFGLGWTKINLGDFPAAEKLFDEFVKRHPDDKLIPRARYARGMARYQRKDFAAASDDVQALLAADPAPAERADARYLLGLCQAGLQQYAAAAATLQTLLDEEPKYAGADKALYELAWALKRQDKEKEAAAAFARLAAEHARSPLAAEAQSRVGDFAYQSGDWKGAAAAYRAARQQAGQSDLGRRATFFEGESWLKLEKFAEALEAYDQLKAPADKEFDAIALLHAGQAAARLGQWDKCLELSAKCVAASPAAEHLPEALCQQGWAQQNLGKPEDAAALYRQVLAQTDREPAAEAQFHIGQLQFARKDYAAAKESFWKVSYGYSYPHWQAEATFEAARCLEALGDNKQAVKQYQELIEKHPQSDKAPAAKQRIEDLRK